MEDNMKQVTIYELDETLSEHHEYTQQEIKRLLTKMAVKARCMGYKDVTYTFESTMEPYEDYLGSPIVRVRGWIAKTERDLEAESAHKEQQDLAEELGCTFYEAGQYLMLKKKGIVK